MSLGKYKAGGSIPFDEGACPVCLGKGFFEEQVVEEDVLIVLFDKQMFLEPGRVAQLPDNSAQIIGERIRSWDKVIRATRMVLNTDVYNDGSMWKKYGEPFPVGLYNGDDKSGSKWFYCYLEREAGG